MTKKSICIFLVLAVLCCMILAACRGTQEQNPETAVETTENTTSETNATDTKKEAVCVITIAINPELELYVQADMTVTDVVFKNSDAEAAFTDIELANRPLIDCLFVLYDVAYDNGHLQNGSHIDISFVSDMDEAFITMLKDEVWMTLSDFQERKQVEIIPTASVTNADGSTTALDFTSHPGSSENPDENDSVSDNSHNSDNQFDEENFKLVERDEHGNVIKTVQENAEGRDITILYTYDANNRLLAESVSQYDSLGNPSYHEKTYTYDANGTVLSAESVYSSGVTVEYTYQNGQVLTQKSHDPSNGYVQTFTYQNGVLVSNITEMPDGKYEKWYYDENGTLTERYGFTQSGRAIHSVYNPDGSYTSYITEDDGSTTVEQVDANGNVT